MSMCGSTGRRCHPLPTFKLVEKLPSPAQSLNSSTEYRGVGYGPCMDRRGVNATDVQHIANTWKPLACTVSELIDGVQDERGKGLSTHRRPVNWGLVCEG